MLQLLKLSIPRRLQKFWGQRFYVQGVNLGLEITLEKKITRMVNVAKVVATQRNDKSRKISLTNAKMIDLMFWANHLVEDVM